MNVFYICSLNITVHPQSCDTDSTTTNSFINNQFLKMHHFSVILKSLCLKNSHFHCSLSVVSVRDSLHWMRVLIALCPVTPASVPLSKACLHSHHDNDLVQSNKERMEGCQIAVMALQRV